MLTLWASAEELRANQADIDPVERSIKPVHWRLAAAGLAPHAEADPCGQPTRRRGSDALPSSPAHRFFP
jgi:hypothetical protein